MRVGTNINPIGPFLQLFFAEHMVAHKRASAQTIASYRDTFRLLLQFMQRRTGIPPAALALTAVDADCILDFLNHVEQHRGCSARSRNNRLAAIRTFFRFVSLRDPTSLGMITRIMAIPNKLCEKKLVGFLSRDEVKALIVAPDSRTWSGRRDHALLLTLYNTGGRISEVIGLRRRQVRLDAGSANIQLLGKGRKERVVPLGRNRTRASSVVSGIRGYSRRHRLSECPEPAIIPRRCRLHSSPGRSGRDGLLSNPGEQVGVAAPPATQHGDAFAPVRCRSRSNRPMAWSREHPNDQRLHNRRSGFERTSAR
jgi:integrase/recombinase XerD